MHSTKRTQAVQAEQITFANVQGRPYAVATDAAALGPAPQGRTQGGVKKNP